MTVKKHMDLSGASKYLRELKTLAHHWLRRTAQWADLALRSAPARLQGLRARWRWPRIRSLALDRWHHLRRPGITARLAIAFVVVALLAVAANLIVEHGAAIIETTTTIQSAA